MKAKDFRGVGIVVNSDLKDDDDCFACCTTVVMGDSKAVPLAQTAHLQMLLDGIGH